MTDRIKFVAAMALTGALAGLSAGVGKNHEPMLLVGEIVLPALAFAFAALLIEVMIES